MPVKYLTIPAAANFTLLQAAPTSVASTASGLLVGQANVSGAEAQRSGCRFALDSGMGARLVQMATDWGFILRSAALTFNQSLGEAGATAVTTRRITQSGFNPAEATWNVYSTGNNWQAGGGGTDLANSTIINAPSKALRTDTGEFSIDVLGHLKSAIAAEADNLDIIIKLVNDGVTSVIAASFDSIASDPAPTLVVGYVVPMGNSVRRFLEAVE